MSHKPTMDWEYFLTDLDPATTPPRLPPRLRRYAVVRTCRVLWIYRRHGWIPAQRFLRTLPAGPASATLAALPTGTAIRLARRELFTSQLLLRAVLPNGLCLLRSLALATYLCALGLPAEVTLARPLTTVSLTDDFHSWTELYGVVLNDNPDVQLGYRVLHRVTALKEKL